MNEQLTLISETIALPPKVATFTARGLVISHTASDTDLIDIGHRLFAARGYLKWAVGSVFSAMLERKKKGGLFSDKWVSDFALAHHIDPKEKRELIGVFTFYRGATIEDTGGDKNDLPPLSYEHYREAMWGVDDGKKDQLGRALSFLAKAREGGGMSVTALRRYIRTSEATEHPEPIQSDFPNYGVVFEFRRYCARELDKVEKYTQEQARAILRHLGDSTISYIQALQEIAQNPTQSPQEPKPEARQSSSNRPNLPVLADDA